MRGRRARIEVALGVIAMTTALVGCANAQNGAATTNPSPGFPKSVNNCGQQVTITRPPKRAIGYYQQAVEMMLALGLQDSIAARVYPDNDPLPQYADAYRRIPELSAKDASFEQILGLSPDFVYGGYRSALDDAAGRSRAAFDRAGIATYLNPEFCAVKPITMDDVYREVHTIADFFGVQPKADSLIAQMQSSISAASEQVKGSASLRVFVYDSGTGTAFTAGRKGIINQIIRLAGGINIFDDTDGTFVDASWEQVLQRSPDAILILDYFGTPSVKDKKDFLKGRPELADLPAILQDRIAVLALQDVVLGVRAPFAVANLAAQLHPEKFR